MLTHDAIGDADRILEQMKINTQRVFNNTKDIQKQKFERLTREKQAAVLPPDTTSVDKTNWIINLSSKSLSDAEIALLKKGLNFAVTPGNIPATEIIAKVESAVRQLDAEHADTVRRAVNTILRQAEPPEPKITEEMRDALKRLKEDDSIMVLPADKGRASVVMDTNTYHAKNDPSLPDRTTLTPAQIADLLNFVLRSTYFQYNRSIYEQREGAAMGSLVSG